MLGQQITKAAARPEHSVKGFLARHSVRSDWPALRHPVDGHDRDTRRLPDQPEGGHGSSFHVVTTKAGTATRKTTWVTYHGVQAFDIETGKFQLPAAPAPTFTNVFADALIDAAKGPARCGHYGGNADRHGPQQIREGVSRPLPRRRHLRAACRNVQRRPRHAGLKPVRDLLDVSPTGV